MNKAKMNYFVDILMGFSFLITAVTGLILFFFLPGGVSHGRYQLFMEITKGTWLTVHNWAGIVIIILVIIHFILHWNWMVDMTKNLFKKESRSTSHANVS
ncbi:MAG: DUF4405 domain-containing protein [archaeon]|nr:DUF4405 domain-containing protein [archaeon]